MQTGIKGDNKGLVLRKIVTLLLFYDGELVC